MESVLDAEIDKSALLATGAGKRGASGVEFHLQTAAYFAARAVSGKTLSEIGFGNAKVESIRLETETAVDDVLIQTDAGGYIAIQAKVSLRNSSSSESELAKVADQFVRYWILSHSGITEFGWDRPLSQDRDRLILAVGPGASKHIRKNLRLLLDIHRKGTTLITQAKFDRSIFDGFRQHLSSAWIKRGGRSPSEAELTQLLNVCAVMTLDFEDSHKQLAEDALAPWLQEAEQAGVALSMLYQEMARLAATRSGATKESLRRMLAAGNGTEGARILIGRVRERSRTKFDIVSLAQYLFLVPLIRLCRTVQWATEITSIGQIDNKPEHVLSSVVATIFLSITGVLALLVTLYSIGFSALNTNWTIGRYIGSLDVLSILAYQLRHMLVSALRGHLTAEGCTFFACIITSLVITWGCAIAASAKMQSIASRKLRREFSGYAAVTVLLKFNIVSWLAALALLSLTFALPSRWLQHNDAWIVTSIVDACLILPWLWAKFTVLRRGGHQRDDSKIFNQSAISLFVPLGLVLPVALFGEYVSVHFQPKIEGFMQSSCFTAGERCVISLRGKDLPSAVIVDEIRFVLSATLWDEKGKPVSAPFGVSALLQVRKPLQDEIPVEIDDNDLKYGAVAEVKFVCPFDSMPPLGRKLFITSKDGYSVSQIIGAPALDDRMTIPIEFNMPVGNLFRDNSEKCPIYP